MLRAKSLSRILCIAAALIAAQVPTSAVAGERFKAVGPQWLGSGLYAGKTTAEVEDCFCPEQLVIGFQVSRYLKFGFSRTKLPMVGDERDEALRKRRYGGIVLLVLPF